MDKLDKNTLIPMGLMGSIIIIVMGVSFNFFSVINTAEANVEKISNLKTTIKILVNDIREIKESQIRTESRLDFLQKEIERKQ